MLLKKQENDTVIKVMYNSSNVIASIYEKQTQDLTLIFAAGTQYKYPNVSTSDYTRFELAESQGKVFNSHIKKPNFTKLDPINPEAILTEIATMKKAGERLVLKLKQDKIVKAMKTLIAIDDVMDGDLFTQATLAPLQAAITEFLTPDVKKAVK
jgi:hypothetical protein